MKCPDINPDVHIYPDEGANLQFVRDYVRWETRVLSDFQENKRNFFSGAPQALAYGVCKSATYNVCYML